MPQWYVNLKKNVKHYLRTTVIYCSLPGVICDFTLSTVTFELIKDEPRLTSPEEILIAYGLPFHTSEDFWLCYI